MVNEKKRIMIVEDDAVLANTMKRRLELEGLEPIIILINSSRMKEGITAILEQIKKSKIDAIILDYIFDVTPAVSTPETSGPAVLHAIREYDKKIPIIAYSGYPNDLNQRALIKDNITFIVFKGEENAIIDTVKKFLGETDKIVEELKIIVQENPKAEKPILFLKGKSYSLKQMLNEILKGSPEGIELYSVYKAGLAEILGRITKKEKI